MPTTNARTPMLPTDALFWHAEEAMPEIRLQVGALLLLDREPECQRLRASLEHLVSAAPRLRQRVADTRLSLGSPVWEQDPQFDLEYHLREIVLPQPGSRRNLLDFAGKVLVGPLDHLRPLWEAYVIGGLERGGAACLFKIHHAIADGVGLLTLFETLTDAGRRDAPHRTRRRARAGAPDAAAVADDRGVGTHRESLLAGLGRAVWRPLTLARRLSRSAGALGGMVRDFSFRALRDPLADRDNSIGRRLDALLLSLPRLKRLSGAAGATLNDLMLTAVAGAVGRYHARCGLVVPALECVVPTNLRDAHDDLPLGNRLGVILLPLPVGERDPLRRLAAISSHTTAAKNGGGASGGEFLMRVLALMPGAAVRAAAQTVHGRIGLVCTNIPGPRGQRYLAGARVDAICPFLPAVIGMPLTVALLSYGETCAVGIDTNPAAIMRPELLCEDFHDALDEIECRVLPRQPPRRCPHRSAARAAGSLTGAAATSSSRKPLATPRPAKTVATASPSVSVPRG